MAQVSARGEHTSLHAGQQAVQPRPGSPCLAAGQGREGRLDRPVAIERWNNGFDSSGSNPMKPILAIANFSALVALGLEDKARQLVGEAQ